VVRIFGNVRKVTVNIGQLGVGRKHVWDIKIRCYREKRLQWTTGLRNRPRMRKKKLRRSIKIESTFYTIHIYIINKPTEPILKRHR